MVCPEGTSVSTGGYEPAESYPLGVGNQSEAAPLVGPYPVFKNYPFLTGETGWVLQNVSTTETLTLSVFAICLPIPTSP